MQQLLEQAPGLILWLRADGAIVLSNATAREQLAMVPGETRLQDLVDDAGADSLQGAMERVLATGSSETVELTVDGSDRRPRSLRGPLVRSDEGEGESSLVVFLQDVTDEVRMRKELRRLREYLQRSQQMDLLGRLARTIAHDFNNVLAVIMGASSLALDRVGPGNPVQEQLEMVLRSATRGSELAKQLRSFSHRECETGTATDIVQHTRDLLPILKIMQGKQVTVALESSLDSAWVQMDPARFEQVLINLAFNARDAMPEGGQLTINICRSSEEGQALFEFSDTGVGMDEETRARVSQLCRAGEDAGDGSGLGLVIIGGAVAAAGGSIEIRSEQGSGTTALIELPLRESAAQTDERPDQVQVQAQVAPQVTAVVEDEPGILRVVCQSVEQSGSKVLSFDGVEAAREHLVGSHEQLDLLITDLSLADGDGLELARELSDTVGVSRVLVMTGNVDPTQQDEIRSRGGWEVLMKPFTTVELGDAVNALMARDLSRSTEQAPRG